MQTMFACVFMLWLCLVPCSKVVRKSIARVLTVYRQNIRAALTNKILEDAKNKKGKVSSCHHVYSMMIAWVDAATCLLITCVCV